MNLYVIYVIKFKRNFLNTNIAPVLASVLQAASPRGKGFAH